MMVNTAAAAADDDDETLSLDLLFISTDISSIQNPSSHSEEVSGIMKRMWVELLIFIVR